VTLSSRDRARGERAIDEIQERAPDARKLSVVELNDTDRFAAAVAEHDSVIAAGAAGVEFLNGKSPPKSPQLRVAIDLNAVPPAGLGWIQPHDKAEQREGVICYGAIGVGGFKMKLHRRAIAALFESNDRLFDAEQLMELAAEIATSPNR
jgi:hypothetical protein